VNKPRAPLPVITEARARELLETAQMRRHSQLSKTVPIEAHELEALCQNFINAGAGGPVDVEKVIAVVRRHIHSSHFMRIEPKIREALK
jgi:UDP-N-acetylenolpyruvoylglucosamine reductase